jgi:hypothetical protein
MMIQAIHFPAELGLVALSPKGLLASYRFNLEDFFGSAWANPNLKLEHFWPGHQKSVSSFINHPRLSYIASICNDGEINYYRVDSPQVSIFCISRGISNYIFPRNQFV